jgi:hypothetical protein
MNAIDLMKQEIGWAHEFLDMVTADITPEQLGWIPPGIANPAGAILAHAVCGEDSFIAILKGTDPLFEGAWAGNRGVSEPKMGMDQEWARRISLDLSAFREYTQAVYRTVDEFASSLKESDLDRQIDISNLGFGVKPLAWVLAALLVSHTNAMIGELSCQIGLQGTIGYPF